MSDLATRLRTACDQVRVKSYPLSDLIPLMQQAADALAAAPAKQPAPSAAAAQWWRSRADEIEAQVAATGSTEAMRCYTDMRTLLQAATNPPSPTPQADSQPAPVAAFEVADAMADSQYLAGVSAGWNAANADDPNAALQKLHESRTGYLKPLSAARAPADSVLEDAARDVLAERQRQISAEGWTPEHDDEHYLGELSQAAACYASQAFGNYSLPTYWPWAAKWWKPSKDPRRNLIKAGALILAEIERLDRAARKQGANHD